MPDTRDLKKKSPPGRETSGASIAAAPMARMPSRGNAAKRRT
jgi:hypothetical protein